jgi:L-histidine N-alpha-methyltransferase
MLNQINVREDSYSIDINEKALNDYYSFFTNEEGSDMLPYAYLGSSNIYNNLISKCADYYLFSDEVSLIQSNKTKLSYFLSDIETIIEIGPCSLHAVKNKTINILSCAENLQNYYAIDLCKDYLTDSCNFIQEQNQKLKVLAIEENLLQEGGMNINYHNAKNQKKAIILLGGTLGNFNPAQQNTFIKKISDILSPGDLFLITADTNQDRDSLLKAYNHHYNNLFIKSIIIYLAKIHLDFTAHIDQFNSKCVLDQYGIEMFLVAKEKFAFYLPNYGIISIAKDQEFHGIRSRKFNIQEVTDLLETNKLNVVDILNNSNKMRMFISVKK